MQIFHNAKFFPTHGCGEYISISYSNATLPKNLKVINEEVSEQVFVTDKHLNIFIRIDEIIII